MTQDTKPATPATNNDQAIPDEQAISLPRFKSADLFQRSREIEIDHNGRIYRMRLTHLNKLILTA